MFVAKTDPTHLNLPSESVFDVKSQDEIWFVEEAKSIIFSRSLSSYPITLLLQQIKSEPTLAAIIESPQFDINLLPSCIHLAGLQMIDAFNVDCVQFTPHLNYLKIPALLKHSLSALFAKLTKLPELHVLDDETSAKTRNFTAIAASIRAHLTLLSRLNSVALRHIDAKTLDKFVAQFLLYGSIIDIYLRFGCACLTKAQSLHLSEGICENQQLLEMLECADSILGHKSLWLELNRSVADYSAQIDMMLSAVYEIITTILPAEGDDLLVGDEVRLFGKPANEVELKYRQAIIVAQFVMGCDGNGRSEQRGQGNIIKVSQHFFYPLFVF